MVAEYVKKAVGHGHEMKVEKLSHHLLTVLTHVNSLCVGEGIELEDVLNRNIAKLEARYPKGFSTEASISRVDVEPATEEPLGPFLVAMVNPDDTVAEVFGFSTLASASAHAMDLEAHTECSAFVDFIDSPKNLWSPEVVEAVQKAFDRHRRGL